MFSRLKNFSPWFVPACCVYATVYEETKCDKVVKGLRTCSSGQNASSAANCTQWCHGTLDFSPFTFWLLHRGSFSPEGETNRRSCAVHADNYLRSLPPYCFLNNRLPISISWLLAWLRAFLFQAPRVLLRSCLSKGCMRIRGYCSRLLQQGELIFLSYWKIVVDSARRRRVAPSRRIYFNTIFLMKYKISE